MSSVRLPAGDRRLALACVCALALLANGRALGNRFAMDDEFIVLRNEHVHDLPHLVDALSEPYWPNTAGYMAMYRPVTIAAFALQWDAWHEHPLGYHAVNLALHVAVTALVFLLLAGLTPGTAPALAGAALFAVHPVHVEAVASMVGLGELLAAAFALAACLVYLRGGRGPLTAAAVGGLYLLSVGSKEIGATLPGLLLLVEAARPAAPGREPEGDRDSKAGGSARAGVRAWAGRVLARWPIYLATVVALGVYGVLRVRALGTAVGSAEASFLQPLGRAGQLLTAVSLWPEYLRLMLFPLHLVADYSPGVLAPVTGVSAKVLAGLVIGVLAAAGVWVAWRRERTVALGVLWFAVAVLPVSNLVIPIGVLLAERTLYLPSVGLALSVSGLVAWVWRARTGWRTGAAAVVTLAVGLAGVRSWVRTPAWHDTASIIQTLVRDHPESFRVQWMMASRLRSQGRTEEALRRYRRAVALVPGHYQLQIEYGRAALEAGHVEEAIHSLEVARDAVPELPEAHVFLMMALLDAGRPADAVAEGRRALRWLPDHRGVYHQLAIALTRVGDYPAALAAREQSIRLGGARASWLQYLHEAELLLRTGRPGDAATALATARERAPDADAVPTLPALESAIETADTAVLPYR